MSRKLERKQHLLSDSFPGRPQEHGRAPLLPGVHLGRGRPAGFRCAPRSPRHALIPATKLDVQIHRPNYFHYKYGRVCGHGGRCGGSGSRGASHELHSACGDPHEAVRPLRQLSQAYYSREQWFMGV